MLAGLLALSVSLAPLSEEELARRVYAHLVVGDPSGAVSDARRGLGRYPDSRLLRYALIRALSAEGAEVEAIDEWQRMVLLWDEEKQNYPLIETVAWGVLNKGEESLQMNIRLSALLGAALTRDVKALPLILRELKGSNALLRSTAARLSASFGDAPLKDQLLHLLEKERVWYVRIEVIRAIGQLKMEEGRERLKQIVADPKTVAEERAEALIALASMYETIEKKELEGFASSNRAGLRQLACQIVQHLELKAYCPEIRSLLKDSSPDVRVAALNTLVLLQGFSEECLALLQDSAPEVAITAAWGALCQGEQAGERALRQWIERQYEEQYEGHYSEHARLASAALAVSGKRGVALSAELLASCRDPYVRANLAVGLIGQRMHCDAACDALFEMLGSERQEKWMWDRERNPLFRSLAPSRVRHVDQIPHYPMVVNQMVRLELLSLLSIMRHPLALSAVKIFLRNQTWGAAGAAAATLLEEGDEEALPLVRQLVDDPDEKIRVQAALILALVGSDPSAITVLQAAYPHVDRDLKMHILEALGHIGDRSSLPFLIEVLKEPFQVLRVVAASALIQCLYH